MEKSQDKIILEIEDKICAIGLWIQEVSKNRIVKLSFETIPFFNNNPEVIDEIWSNQIIAASKILQNLRYELYLRRHIKDAVCKKLVANIENDGKCLFMYKIDKKYLNYFTTRSILGKIAQSSNTAEQTKLLEDYKQTIPKTENGKLNLKTIFEKTNTEVKKLNSEEKTALKSHKSDTARDNKIEIAKKEVEIAEKELNLKKVEFAFMSDEKTTKTQKKQIMTKLKKDIKKDKEVLFSIKHPIISLNIDFIKTLINTLGELSDATLELKNDIYDYNRRELTEEENAICDAATLLYGSPVAGDIAADLIRDEKNKEKIKDNEL